MARRHFDGCIKRGELVIRKIKGIENYKAVADRGVLITCNHFNAFDNYAVFKTIQPFLHGRMLWKIIREGNYTSFPGFYGYLFRHCNTLPISSDLAVLKELLDATDSLLKRGEKILIYPEQAMWWNYKKVRPFKSGAFDVAVRQNAPVLPVFITFTDSEVLDVDGFNVKEYTIHVMPPVYPDKVKSAKENSEAMRIAAFKACKEKEKEVYGEL